MKQQWKLMVSLVLVILIVIFSLSNTQPVNIDFFFTKSQVPLVLVILVSLLLGVTLGMIASLTTIGSSRRKIKQLENELTKAQELVTQLNADLVAAKEQAKREEEKPAVNAFENTATEVQSVSDFIKEN
ncbi:lipopolysaccharide assembly protein LapA domain-containing protein [Aerococcaceae bacterium NML190073]|nr:lipopolysaccharide assembly protein LapA domain-containing protein [Aerococcaceae bacterium NML190073]MCW6666410.1 lipopolysaccharide assembly protein LapA domain-containing protein [Aerococcaceae bacterium NML190938]MCW6675378.1 lipopolysaccharide assembly protein LapA domain-containing protein [Aerococcaceae bacterium NML171108]